MSRNKIYPPSVTPGIPKIGLMPEGWIETTFGKVLKPVQRKAELVDDQDYELIVAKRNRGGIVSRSILKGREIKTKSQFYIRENDFLIAKRQIIHGACGIVPKELDGAIVSNEYSVLNVKDGLLLDYLRYYCHTIYFQQTCFQSSIGVDVEKMIFKLDEWFKWPIYLPPLVEQRKISEILMAWDKAIALTELLIATLQERKKGLMQRLLTGEVRFPGFKEEWQEHILGSIAHLTTGGTPSTRIKEYWGGEIRWMNSGEIHKKRIYEVENRITKAGLDNSSAKLLPVNSVLIALAGQGKTRGTVAINKAELSTNQSVAAIMPNENILHHEYLFYDLDSRYEELRKLSTGDGGRGGLNLGLLSSIRVKAPSVDEQIRISDVLCECDTEIMLLTEYINVLKLQKKGLMQRLLTGEVRVKVN
jgi:type I restriction enzyme, S subunit